MYRSYNDYELVYMANEVHDQKAYDILIEKYKNFIYKKIHQYFFYEKDYDDYYQEGIMCLVKAVQSFDQKYNKTFTRYFEVIIDRHFLGIHYKNKKEYELKNQLIDVLILNESIYECSDFKEKQLINKHNLIKLNSKTEKEVYKLYFLSNNSVEFIASKINLNTKQVYNAIHRIKIKLKNIKVEI